MKTIKFRPGAVELMSALACTMLLGACNEAGTFPEQEEICSFDAARETARAQSAATFPAPVISTMAVNGTVVVGAGAKAHQLPRFAVEGGRVA